MGLHWIDEADDREGEDDVAVVFATLGDGAGDDGGAGSGESALSNDCLLNMRISSENNFWHPM